MFFCEARGPKVIKVIPMSRHITSYDTYVCMHVAGLNDKRFHFMKRQCVKSSTGAMI